MREIKDFASDMKDELADAEKYARRALAFKDLDPEAVGAYLASHPSDSTLLQVRARLLAGQPLRIPVLIPSEGGYLVYE